MHLTTIQTLALILVIALGTMITRFTPFLLFPDNKNTPKLIGYLGAKLPAAMMGLLVVYCLRNVDLTDYPGPLGELIAIGVIVLVHHFKGNVLLSIASGTLVYMVLIQYVL